ncbi:MAG: orotate phosphoribosyltransferase [Thermodesulfobacteriota bacterium]|nr:orotate phosphoribosyltransferase [Thermodesulfobacteriota bacterium]
MNDRTALKELVKKDALRIGAFVLASGKRSDLYVDMRKVTLNPAGAVIIGSVIYEIIRDMDIDAIGGMSLGADPIATAASIIAYQRGKEINAFLVRKEKKSHGTQNWIEGPISPGQKVVVVEDVITTGGSTLMAIERIEESGLLVEMVIAVFDRSEGGKQVIESRGYRVNPILCREDL